MIERIPTSEERRDFENIGRGRKLSDNDQFLRDLSIAEAEANKKGLPFCRIAAIDEHQRKTKELVDSTLRKHGYMPKNIKVEINFDKFSDLNNFEMEKNGQDETLPYTDEEYDPLLSKRLNKEVYLKFKVYRYKGYERYKYKVFEPTPGAWDNELKQMPQMRNQKQEETPKANK